MIIINYKQPLVCTILIFLFGCSDGASVENRRTEWISLDIENSLMQDSVSVEDMNQRGLSLNELDRNSTQKFKTLCNGGGSDILSELTAVGIRVSACWVASGL